MRAGWWEAGLAATLLGSFLTVPVFGAHLSLGVAFALLASAHAARRRRIYLAALRRCRRRATTTGALIVSAVVVTLSGFVQWAGTAAAIPWHAASSMLLVLLGVGHAVRRLRAARRRSAPTVADDAH